MEQTQPYTDFAILQGSYKDAPAAIRNPTNGSEIIDVTLRLRGKNKLPDSITDIIEHGHYEEKYGSQQADIEAVGVFAHHYHLSVSDINSARRTVALKGAISDFEKAFNVYLSSYRDIAGRVFRGRTGPVSVPRELNGIIDGVFGLDNRPAARPMLKVMRTGTRIVSHTATGGYLPEYVASVYNFPKNVSGKGQVIGIIELDGGYRSADIINYFSQRNLPVPQVTAVSIDGAHNSPSVADSADGEVMLDIEVAGSVAPDAKIVVYFAPNTDKGFLDAITTAIHDRQNKPSVISISWGTAESNWTKQSLDSFNEAFKAASLLGVTVCVASGDNGSSDAMWDGKAHVDFPASSPYVLACGGTKLMAQGNNILSETVWHEPDGSASGGGISDYFLMPDYQKNAGVPASLNNQFTGRGVPDIAGNADSETGYKILVDGQYLVIGGTSAVAPLYAALIALTNQQNGKQAGFINPIIYAKNNCRDITQGDNITTSDGKGFLAKKGWDACTGMGILSVI